MKQYLDMLQLILDKGIVSENRTGINTISIFGHQERFDLTNGFPATTTKKLAWKSVVSELLWFLEGSGDERRLAEIRYDDVRENLIDSKTIWTANANADYWKDKAEFPGDLGRVYGMQWRHWRTATGCDIDYGTKNNDASVNFKETDQIADVIDKIKNNPDDRRIIISAWNPGELDSMALPPCHLLTQFNIRKHSFETRFNIFKEKYPTVADTHNGFVNREKLFDTYNIPKGYLDCQIYQRSCDTFLGVPFNIASYALLTKMIAHVTGYEAGDFIHTFGDLHIYENHIEQVNEQLTRDPLPLPTLWLNPDIKNIDDFTIYDIKLLDYESHSAIKADMAV